LVCWASPADEAVTRLRANRVLPGVGAAGHKALFIRICVSTGAVSFAHKSSGPAAQYTYGKCSPKRGHRLRVTFTEEADCCALSPESGFDRRIVRINPKPEHAWRT
jgi:hypothetical protein